MAPALPQLLVREPFELTQTVPNPADVESLNVSPCERAIRVSIAELPYSMWQADSGGFEKGGVLPRRSRLATCSGLFGPLRRYPASGLLYQSRSSF